MRLLFLGTNFPNPWEPTRATFNLDLLRSLAESHEVQVVSPVAWTDEVRGRWRGKGRLVRQRRQDRLSIFHPRYWFTPKFFRQHYDRFLWWSIAGQRRRLKREPRPDCILSYWAHPDGAVAGRLARQWGVPSILMVGGSDVLLMARDKQRRKAVQRALQNADAVVAVSQDLAQQVQSLGIAAERVHVLKRGVDQHVFHACDRDAARERLGIPRGQRALLWVGRMVPVKGLETLIAACQKLSRHRDDVHLYLVGDGPLRAELTEQVRQAGLADRVHFVGKQPHDELGHWFRAADLTVLPSLSEGIPNVLLESLACGTPFVASRVGGIPEIGEHAAARLVPPSDPDALGEAIDDMLQQQPQVAPAHRPGTLAEFTASVEALIRRVSARRASLLTCSPVSPRPGITSLGETRLQACHNG